MASLLTDIPTCMIETDAEDLHVAKKADLNSEYIAQAVTRWVVICFSFSFSFFCILSEGWGLLLLYVYLCQNVY